MSTADLPGYNGAERAHYGCLVTFENEHGRTLTIHSPGPALSGLRAACEDALGRDPSNRVVCYSTPQTVYNDLQTRRPGNKHQPTLIEHLMLSRCGMRHMLHPRLQENADARVREGYARERRNKARDDERG